MQVKDFPLLLRGLLAALVIGCLVLYSILSVSVVAIVAMLSARAAHPGAWAALGTITGTLIGAFGTLLIARHLENERSKKEKRTLAASLHAELADRAARCANDYVAPWRDVHYSRPPTKPVNVDWVEKFRPVDPVVYPRIADKLGILPSDALFSVVQFYFRLDAIRREIDGIVRDFAEVSDIQKSDYARLRRVALRFHEALAPALAALERLDVERALEIEAVAASSYDQLRSRSLALRDALRTLQPS